MPHANHRAHLILTLRVSDLLIHTNVSLRRAVILLFVFTVALVPNAAHRAGGQ